jgi:mRNA interferase HigB
LAGHEDQHAVKGALEAWFHEVKRVKSETTAEIKALYASASVVSAERIVFNLNGGSYRLVVAVDFKKGMVWIKWIGPHKAYDALDVTKVQYHGRRKANPH